VPAKLAVSPLAISDASTQVVFRTADLDKDGWVDVVAARKSQGSQVDPRPNLLLMNVHGVLTDKTAQLASASDVPGDQGFLTPTNDREIDIADVNGDGWLDVVTAVALADGQPKAISHPRVYINRGKDGAGHWLGLRNEDARIPQLLTTGGLAVAPRFSGVAIGDVTGDGFPDLYFVDHDGTGTGIPEPAAWDLDDRLLVNDGNGFFTDQSAARFTPAQLASTFGNDVQMADLNADGRLDIVKVNTSTPPLVVRGLYNSKVTVGNFTAMGSSDFGTGAPYASACGDLNHDGFIDIAIGDDGPDRYRFGIGYDLLGRVIWGPPKTFAYVTGADDTLGHSVYLRDLDANGWNDVIVTDVDSDLPGCTRRLHIYHNLGSVAGDVNLVLREESELANGGSGPGWKGVVGMTAADEQGTYDVGFGDFDRDGDIDLLLGTCSGTTYWQNEIDAPLPQKCQTDLGFAGPGNMAFSICGDDLTYAGSLATLTVTGAPPNAALALAMGLTANPFPFKGGLLVPMPFFSILGGFTASGAGTFSLFVPGSPGGPLPIIMQFLSKSGANVGLSNALSVELGF
jgi:FG-GAP-like repeat